ncbi:MAG: energy transducer TonB [Candidatus Saganbacteria bacterium]|nr:energy transducer TonB [Candidatus Saganbacteria bacterium]
MESRKLSLIGIGIILVSAILVGYLVARPGMFAQKKEAPIFWGEEIAVQNKSVTVVGQKAAVRVAKVVGTQKMAKTVPTSQPKVLPIFPPSISYSVLPEYPVSALQEGLAGTTVLSIYVGLQGRPERIEVKSSSGVSELDKAATLAVSKWQFSPAMQGGTAIASRFEVPVKFTLVN